MTSKIFKLNLNDSVKGLIVASLTGAVLVVYSAFTGDGCGIKCIEWMLSLNAGIGAGIAYLIKNFLTDEKGKLGGKL